MENQKSLTVTLLINAIQEYDSNICVADSSTENPLQFFLVPVSKNATKISKLHMIQKNKYIYMLHIGVMIEMNQY